MIIVFIFALDIANVVLFNLLLQLDWLASGITLFLAGSGGFFVSTRTEYRWSWWTFAIAFSLAALAQGLIINIFAGLGISVFSGYLLAWVLFVFPFICFFAWLGSFVGRRARAMTHEVPLN